MPRNNEQLYYDMLKRITQYQSVEHLRKHSERDWGLPFEEALEMAYENVLNDARRAIRGKRRPAIASRSDGARQDAVSTQPEGSGPGVQPDSGHTS